MAGDEARVLDEQREYYRARAGEYDEWFLRRGRYDRGEALNRQWFAEVDEVRRALDAFAPRGDVLELAAGTGLWTTELLRHASRVTAVDASPEVLALNRERVGHDARVDYVQADLFRWRPARAYDAVFFSFWLSHVPPERFDAFWAQVGSALRPGGRAFFMDSARTHTSTAKDHQLPEEGEWLMVRRLNDGREFRIVKVFYDPAELGQRLARLGWEADVRQTGEFFIYGSARTNP